MDKCKRCGKKVFKFHGLSSFGLSLFQRKVKKSLNIGIKGHPLCVECYSHLSTDGALIHDRPENWWFLKLGRELKNRASSRYYLIERRYTLDKNHCPFCGDYFWWKEDVLVPTDTGHAWSAGFSVCLSCVKEKPLESLWNYSLSKGQKLTKKEFKKHIIPIRNGRVKTIPFATPSPYPYYGRHHSHQLL